MKKLLSFLFVLLLVIGCSLPKPAAKPEPAPLVPDDDGVPVGVILHVDKDCSAIVRKQLETASNVWGVQTSGLVVIDLVDDLNIDDTFGLRAHVENGHHLVVCVPEDSQAVAEMEEGAPPGAHVLGWVLPPGGIKTGPSHMVLVEKRLESERGVRVILHELGHLLGMSHIYNDKAIMFPSDKTGKEACLTKSDLLGYCSVQDCGKRELHPCE